MRTEKNGARPAAKVLLLGIAGVSIAGHDVKRRILCNPGSKSPTQCWAT